MKQFKRILAWFLINGLVAVLMYAAVFSPLNTDAGTINVTKFVLWSTSALAWFLLPVFFLVVVFGKPEDKAKLPKKARAVPRWMSHMFDITVVLTAVYAGWIWTGLFYFTHIFAQSLTIILIESANEKPTDTEKAEV